MRKELFILRRPRISLIAAAALPALLIPALVTIAAKPAPVVKSATKATLYIFVSPDCPIANRYSTRIAELDRDYAGRGVAVTLVYSGGDVAFTDTHFAKWAKERELTSVARLRDADGSLAKKLHATTTPQAVVCDAAGEVRYLGRIDDNADKTAVTKSDTRLALDAVLAGKPVAVARTSAFGCAIEVPTKIVASSAGARITYARDVAPILNKNCVSCHRKDDAGPFPLDNYAQAKLWSSAIKSYTQNRKMPPFKADPHYGGPFADTRMLTDAEIQTLARWQEAGAPAGDLKTAPKPPAPRTGDWTLGTPDMVLQPSAPYKLSPDGSDEYRDFAVSEPMAEDTYIKAMDFLPGNRAIVHHIIMYIDMTGATCAEKEGKSPDGQPGWAVSGAGSGVKTWEWASGWAPGMNPAFLQDGMAVKVPKGARLVLQVHYHKSGKVETDLSKVAVYTAKPTEKIDQIIKVATLGNPLFVLKPNVADNEVRAAMNLPYAATVYQVMPHMHYLGKKMTVTAKTPDGATIPIIKIDDWEFQWQMAYRYEKPIHLPAGTRLEMTAIFDNTADNPYQPLQPPREVRFGESTTDEMCFAFLGLVRDTPPTQKASAK